jgi:hypothetical protein
MKEEQNVNASLESLSRKPFTTTSAIINNMCKNQKLLTVGAYETTDCVATCFLTKQCCKLKELKSYKLTSKNLDDSINMVRVSRGQALLNLKNDYNNNKVNNKQGKGERIA